MGLYPKLGKYDFLNAYSKGDLIKAIEAYDVYIIEAFDDEEKINSGWVPVCFNEFITSEECWNYVDAL